MDFVRETIAEYRVRADERRTEGADSVAQLYDKVAQELGERLELWENEELTIQAAAEFSGYTTQALYRIKKSGVTLCRRNLPKKATRPRPSLVTQENGRPSLADQIVNRRSA